jgi:tetratricopeptide (TPR) repeat protein
LGCLQIEQGHYAAAETWFRRALDIQEKSAGRRHPQTAVLLHNLAVLYGMQNRYGEAEALFDEALKIQETLLGPDHPEVARTLFAYASLLSKNRQKGQAMQMSRRAQKIMAGRTIDLFQGHTVDVRSLRKEHD